MNLAERKKVSLQCSSMRPSCFFLTGGNGLKTQASAAENGGCGIVLVPEIKSGKVSYSDADGSYAPLLSFYDRQLPGVSFRKAEDISMIQNCRIQIFAAGVKED